MKRSPSSPHPGGRRWGDDALRYLRYRNTETGQVTEYRPPPGRPSVCSSLPATSPPRNSSRGWRTWTNRAMSSPTGGRRPPPTASTPPGMCARSPCVRWSPPWVTGPWPPRSWRSTPRPPSRGPACAPRPLRRRPLPAPRRHRDRGRRRAACSPEMAAQLQTVFSRMTASPGAGAHPGQHPPVPGAGGLYAGPVPVHGQAHPPHRWYRPGRPLRPGVPGRQHLDRPGLPRGAGGHEFTSFVLGLYNAAGPGQALDEATMAAIQAIQQPTDLQILVSLSCTMCPELVTAAQRLAAANPITAQAYDLNHFPALRDQYKVMSVPCLVVNHGQQVSFGKKIHRPAAGPAVLSPAEKNEAGESQRLSPCFLSVKQVLGGCRRSGPPLPLGPVLCLFRPGLLPGDEELQPLQPNENPHPQDKAPPRWKVSRCRACWGETGWWVP